MGKESSQPPEELLLWLDADLSRYFMVEIHDLLQHSKSHNNSGKSQRSLFPKIDGLATSNHNFLNIFRKSTYLHQNSKF